MQPLSPLPLFRTTPTPPAAAPMRSAASPDAAARIAPAPALPNPRLRLEPALGLVVLEFRDNAGEIASTIPTQRELDAYRSAAWSSAPATQASSASRGEAGPPVPVPAAATT